MTEKQLLLPSNSYSQITLSLAREMLGKKRQFYVTDDVKVNSRTLHLSCVKVTLGNLQKFDLSIF